MTDESRTDIGTPTPEELREQIEHTRDELGQTVEALAAKADVPARAKEKTAAAKEQAAEKAALVSGQIRSKAEHAAQLVAHKTPQPILDRGRQAAALVRANRTPVLAAGAALALFLLLRHGRRSR
ncbi:DUF3618 domain-containing protein [Streptomyces sp. NPDC054838]